MHSLRRLSLLGPASFTYNLLHLLQLESLEYLSFTDIKWVGFGDVGRLVYHLATNRPDIQLELDHRNVRKDVLCDALLEQ